MVSPEHQFDDRWWASSALARDVTTLPGLAKPILYPWFGGAHAWTVSESNALEAFEGGFPLVHMGDVFAVEAGTGRVVGASSRGVYAFDQQTGQFRLIAPARFGHGIGEAISEAEFRDVYTVTRIERLGLTLIGTGNGVFQLHGETVQALAGAGKRDVGPVVTIIDLPVHGAVLLAGYDSAMLRHDDGTVEKLIDTSGGWLHRASQVVRAFESKQPGRIVINSSGKTLLEIEMRTSPAGYSPGRTSTLLSSSGNLWPIYLATRSGEFLILNSGSWWTNRRALERLDAEGMHVVPGARIPDAGGEAWLRDIPSRGQVLINGRDGLYVYDGRQVTHIPESAPDRAGRYPLVSDVPSIGKVVVKTVNGLFELTAGGRLEALRLPFEYSFEDDWLGDLPAAHVGLITTNNNLFALTEAGTILPIDGGGTDRYSMNVFAGVIPGRNAMLVRGKTMLHLIVDASQPGSACNPPLPAARP